MHNEPIIVESLFDASVAKVWSAISDKNEMMHWYFDLEEFEAIVGFKFEITGGPDEDRQYLHLCEVTQVEHESKLTYSWRYDGYKGISFVTFELFPKGQKTLLKLTHKGIGSFPKKAPDLAAKNFLAGWDAIINSSLKEYLKV